MASDVRSSASEVNEKQNVKHLLSFFSKVSAQRFKEKASNVSVKRYIIATNSLICDDLSFQVTMSLFRFKTSLCWQVMCDITFRVCDSS